MKINIHREVEIESTIRTELLSSMFEVPAKTKLSVSLTGDIPNSPHYNIGLIVGPSGSGKTLLLNEIFGEPRRFYWNSKSVIDDFDTRLSMEEITRVCQSVGFNTVPSWMRPYSVLSNGERFRVEVARHLVSDSLNENCLSDVIRIDEFTSVVDRQVAQFACHSIQKYVRENNKHLVVASCHYDIIPWLQPDWILEPGNPCRFTWRSLQSRPPITCQVSRCKYETWQLFKDFHYMSADLNRAARCYGLFVESPQLDGRLAAEYNDEHIRSYSDGRGSNTGNDSRLRLPRSSVLSQRDSDSSVVLRQDDECEDSRDAQAAFAGDESTGDSAFIFSKSAAIHESLSNQQISVVPVSRCSDPTYRIASMCGVLHRPHPKVSDICGFTRMVTLPDFQGLGLAFVLACKVASAYKALGKRLHSYPNHPAWIRSYQRSSLWMQVKDSGSYSPRRGSTSTVGGFGNKRCAVFQYIGDAMNREEAERLINVDKA